MKNIALGQFYPSDSILHRLDSRMKVLLAVLFVVCAFLPKGLIGFSVLLVSCLLLIALGRIPLRTVLGGLKPVFVILLFTVVLNVFWTVGDHLLVSWKFIHIYEEGLWRSAFLAVRIFALVIGSSMFLSYTTTPIALTDGIESLLSPLKVLHVPVHDFAMIMSLALRFIPTLTEETDRILAAQKSRGADLESGGLIRKAKALIPIMIPLIVSSFRRADELATAMEARCYHGGKGRTKMNIPHLRAKDFIALALMVILGAGIVALRRLEFGYLM